MEDPVLLSRLKSLSNNLAMVIANLEDKLRRPTESLDARTESLEQALWDGMKATIYLAIQRKLDDLETEIDKLQRQDPKDHEAPSIAWQRYSNILRDSQILLRECLEIIGTLALRSKDLDQKILYLADELARDCLNVTMADRDYYLTVHGLGDTLPLPRARIIRMRFPDWTIWDLPLIAHELGHAAIAKKLSDQYAVEDLEPFLTEQRKLLLNQDARLRLMMQQPGSEQDLARNWARGRVSIFVADAFATYTMGPAYACSAINLRFNPWIEAHNAMPSDAQRAFIVMSMLRWMDDYHLKQMSETRKRNPYEKVITRLKSDWDSAMARSESKCSIATAEEEKYLTDFTHDFAHVICRRIFMQDALYPLEGWERAEGWCDGWLEQQQKRPPLTIPPNANGKLRDALNATWLCRLLSSNSSQIEKNLADVGKQLCEAIIEAPTTKSLIPSATSTR